MNKNTSIAKFTIPQHIVCDSKTQMPSLLNPLNGYEGDFQTMKNGITFNYTCLNHQTKKSKYYTFDVIDN